MKSEEHSDAVISESELPAVALSTVPGYCTYLNFIHVFYIQYCSYRDKKCVRTFVVRVVLNFRFQMTSYILQNTVHSIASFGTISNKEDSVFNAISQFSIGKVE